MRYLTHVSVENTRILLHRLRKRCNNYKCQVFEAYVVHVHVRSYIYRIVIIELCVLKRYKQEFILLKVRFAEYVIYLIGNGKAAERYIKPCIILFGSDRNA